MFNKLMKQVTLIAIAVRIVMNERQDKAAGQQRVLAVLNMEDGLTQSHLAEFLKLKPGSLAELVKKLEQNGDISRSEDANDKRIKRVYITEKGRLRLSQMSQNDNTDHDFFKGLNEDEQRQFSHLMNKVIEGWDEELRSQTQRFMDPRERMAQLNEMREQIRERYGKDFDEMSSEERRQAVRKYLKQ